MTETIAENTPGFDRDRNRSTILADHYIPECEILEKYLSLEEYVTEQ